MRLHFLAALALSFASPALAQRSSMGMSQGVDLPEDETALKLFREAEAAQERGNFKEMVKKAEASRRRGSMWAARLLAEAYMFGRGVPENHPKAFELAKEAADKGDILAAQHCGILLMRGKGIPQDLLGAREWFDRVYNRCGMWGIPMPKQVLQEQKRIREMLGEDKIVVTARAPTAYTPLPIHTPEPIATPAYPPAAPVASTPEPQAPSCSRCTGRGTVYRTARAAGYYTELKPGYSGTDSSHYEYTYSKEREAGWDPCPQCGGSGKGDSW